MNLHRIAVRIADSWGRTTEYWVSLSAKPGTGENGDAWGDWAVKWFDSPDSQSGTRREELEDRWDTMLGPAQTESDFGARDTLAIFDAAGDAFENYMGKLFSELEKSGYNTAEAKKSMEESEPFFPCNGPAEFMKVMGVIESVVKSAADAREKEMWDTFSIKTSIGGDVHSNYHVENPVSTPSSTPAN